MLKIIVSLVVGVLSIPSLADTPVPKRAHVSSVIVDPTMVTSEKVAHWKGEGFNAICITLDDSHPAEAYVAAAKAAADNSIELYYWIEVGRNPAMAAEHPNWMASLGMHNDWQRRFPDVRPPKDGEVAKAFPWVPITYREAYDAHLARVKELLTEKVASPYTGVLLNDLQGGPSSCGCGNLQCRWATDYHVPSTATKLEGDDIAARFIADVRKLAPGKMVVPVWTTECEDIDLPPKLAPGGKSTGLSGDVPCANATCPKVFTKQLTAVLTGHDGPVGILALQQELERDAAHGHPGIFAPRAIHYVDTVPPKNGGSRITHERLWLVIEGHGLSPEEQATSRHAHRKMGIGGVFQSLVPVEQSFEPRLINVK